MFIYIRVGYYSKWFQSRIKLFKLEYSRNVISLLTI
jgi:hypothetical protein